MLEGVEFRREELDEAVYHGAHGLDVRAELHLSQTVGRTHAAAQDRRIGTIVAGALALCTAVPNSMTLRGVWVFRPVTRVAWWQ